MEQLRQMKESDRAAVLSMMREFYDSPAVLTSSSDRVLERDFNACVGGEPLLDGYIFEENGKIIGYAMAAHCYATEYGGLCIWIEDLYILPEYRHHGVSHRFFEWLPKQYPNAVRFKLEAERENINAVSAYLKSGYAVSPYLVMTREYPAQEDQTKL